METRDLETLVANVLVEHGLCATAEEAAERTSSFFDAWLRSYELPDFPLPSPDVQTNGSADTAPLHLTDADFAALPAGTSVDDE